MANKIDNVVDAIETKVKELVSADGTGVLKKVQRAVLIPATISSPPVVGLVVSRLFREVSVWEAEVLIMLVANKGDVTVDQRITEIVGELEDKIEALIAAGTAGGHIDKPVWDIWYSTQNPTAPLSQVGAIGSLRIRVEPPLKIPT